MQLAAALMRYRHTIGMPTSHDAQLYKRGWVDLKIHAQRVYAELHDCERGWRPESAGVDFTAGLSVCNFARFDQPSDQ